MTDYEWTEEMGEISGFGGIYEEACRQMVISGAEWLDDNPDADPKMAEISDVFGIVREVNDDAEELSDVMAEAARSVGDTDEGPTGAMMHACVRHVIWINEHSWEEYVGEFYDG